MNCSVFAEKNLDTLDYAGDNLATLGISDKLFLALKKGHSAFPLAKRMNAANFDGNVRNYLLSLCQIKQNTLIANPMEFPRLFNGSKSLQELTAIRRAIAAQRDELHGNYQRLLQSVSKAGAYIPNPLLSRMRGKPGNEYYDKTHDMMFDLNKAMISNCDSAVQRIDKFITNKQRSNTLASVAAGQAQAAARHRQEVNANAAKYGLPPGSNMANVLAARLASLRLRGGKTKRSSKAKRSSTKRRQTRRKT